MLDFNIKLHRNYLPADTEGQKLFILFEIDSKNNDDCVKPAPQKLNSYKVIMNITNIIKNMKIEWVSKVYPVQSEIDPSSNPIVLGDVEEEDSSIFLMETSVPGNKQGKISLFRVNLACSRNDGSVISDTIKSQDIEISVEYSNYNAFAYRTDKEVMHYIQQRNIYSMIEQAENESANNINKAIKILKSAMKTAALLNNASMTKILGSAIKDIEDNNAFKEGTIKTLKSDIRTRTVKFDKNIIFTDEEIKKITGV